MGKRSLINLAIFQSVVSSICVYVYSIGMAIGLAVMAVGWLWMKIQSRDDPTNESSIKENET